MEQVKFHGLLGEILDSYENIDLVQFLQKRLGIPEYMARALAERIESNFNLKRTYELREKSREMRPREIEEKKDVTPTAINIYALDNLSGREFEYFLKWLFEEMSYAVELTKITADSGVDLVVNKDNEKIAVQAKRYKRTMKISNNVILKTHGGKDIYGCSKSMVVATSYFTQQAIKDAKKLNIELWDRDALSAKIDGINEKVKKLQEEVHFPKYKGSLLKSLVNLESMGIFVVERKDNGKYDIHRHGVRYPVLSFQTRSLNTVTRCVFRIRNNKPVREYEGYALIRSDRHFRYGPHDEQAYEKIIEYLRQFV
jgi:HJR/Mrr/RecB family endonuclease